MSDIKLNIYDFLHRLVGIAGCVDDERRSAKRIIAELQDLGVGDVLEIAPGMGYSVVGLEPEQALILQSILDTVKWESVSSNLGAPRIPIFHSSNLPFACNGAISGCYV